MSCSICGSGRAGDDKTHLNLICDECDQRAVNEHRERPWHGWPPGEEPESKEGVINTPPDRGENPVFIDGWKCWRRYRFGGWMTMIDEHDCDTLEEFYETHDMFD
ncbi:hypothetical protein NDI76_19275 [Halogeometricum sp. S1BR25-6]|uniref:Uncharacterized protein n=1 Tax=Halogeometricum salsisoli TaxID=2950536 RepID=A0ABU2GJB1_9EURY|nr:hypothetical protein [Halogeometricum sp. S1BR25-6]MDS0300895.1 hypothetical protein [Halogeometricum sp. S1BR25-6]